MDLMTLIIAVVMFYCWLCGMEVLLATVIFGVDLDKLFTIRLLAWFCRRIQGTFIGRIVKWLYERGKK